MPVTEHGRRPPPQAHVFVGRIGRAHGLRGDVLVRPDSDHPARFQPPSRLFTDHPDFPELVVSQSRPHSKGGLIVRFETVNDRTVAEALRGVELYIPPEERRPLAPGEFWPDQLVGLDVRVAGSTMGQVVTVDLETAQTRLEVELHDGTRVWVPFVEPLVPVVDLVGGFVDVVDLPGLLSSGEESA